MGEWLSGTLEPTSLASEKVMKDMFDFFDIDSDDKISVDELIQVLGDSEAENITRDADTSGDSQLEYEEFKTLMLQIAWGDKHYKGMSPTSPKTRFSVIPS